MATKHIPHHFRTLVWPSESKKVMEPAQDQLDELRQRVRQLEDQDQRSQKKLSLIKEMLSSQKMMLEDAVAYSTRLEVELAQYES